MTPLLLPLGLLSNLLNLGSQVELAHPSAPGQFRAILPRSLEALTNSRMLEILVDATGCTIVPPNVYFNLKLVDIYRIALLQFRSIQERSFDWSCMETTELCNISCCSPNANKPLHLGHARNLALGDSIASLFLVTGHSVEKTCLFSDYGIHIARVLAAQDTEHLDLCLSGSDRKGDHVVGLLYQLGSLLREDKVRGSEIRQLEFDLLSRYLKGEPEVLSRFRSVTTQAIQGILESFARFTSQFDRFFYESDSIPICVEIINDGIKAGTLLLREDGSICPQGYESDSAATLQRQDGSPLYLLQSIASSLQRIRAYQPHTIGLYLSLRAEEQTPVFAKYSEIWSRLGFPPLRGREIVSYGLVYNGSSRMKSRASGSSLLLDDVLDQISARSRAGCTADKLLRLHMLSQRRHEPMHFHDVSEVLKADESIFDIPHLAASMLESILPSIEENGAAIRSENRLALNACLFPATIIRALRHREPYFLYRYLQNAVSLYQKVPQSQAERVVAPARVLISQIIQHSLNALGFRDLRTGI